VRVALDTNVLVSAVATRGLCADIFNLVLAEHELILGATVLRELQRVLRQKLRIPADTIREYDELLRREAVVVAKAKALPVAIRDESDIPVLAEAVEGGAEVLVSGDRDLLDIADKSPIRIVTPRELWVQLTT
jgi:putative PIN family toxin of toxin-antitoxin system